MTELTERDRELVAIGASIGSNCVPCIAFHVGKARETGLTDGQIEAAIELSEEIRAMPAALVVNTARAYLEGESIERTDSPTSTGSGECGCEEPPSEYSGSSNCGC
jgi:4-carboxymuconolactone decarboxylase